MGRRFQFLSWLAVATQLFVQPVQAQNENLPALLSITFDDSIRSQHRIALPIMQEFDVRGTIFVVTGFVDTATRIALEGEAAKALVAEEKARIEAADAAVDDPLAGAGEKATTVQDAIRDPEGDQNASGADIERAAIIEKAEEAIRKSEERWSMTWAEVNDFRDAGWEIASHSVTHPHLPEHETERVISEIETAEARIKERTGINPVSFSSPFGAYNEETTGLVMDRHSYHVLAWSEEEEYNAFPDVDPSRIGRFEVSSGMSPQRVCGEIVNAVLNQAWLVLMFHDFVDGAPDDYDYIARDLYEILACAAFLRDQGALQIATVQETMELIGQSQESLQDLAPEIASELPAGQ